MNRDKGQHFRYICRVVEPQVSEAGARAVPIRGGKERILFVDDEDILVDLYKERLIKLGYDVVATTSSTEALELFKKEPDKFDLVITDYTMPHLTGMDLATELLKVRRSIPIILFTGHSDNVSPETAKAAGISELLMKPQSKG